MREVRERGRGWVGGKVCRERKRERFRGSVSVCVTVCVSVCVCVCVSVCVCVCVLGYNQQESKQPTEES